MPWLQVRVTVPSQVTVACIRNNQMHKAFLTQTIDAHMVSNISTHRFCMPNNHPKHILYCTMAAPFTSATREDRSLILL